MEGQSPRFADRVVLVTGAGSGIGRACAIALRAGGRPCDRRRPHACGPPALKTLLGKIVDVEADVTDPAAWERLVGLASGLGGLDVLVSNAGVMASGPEAHVASARPSLVRRSLAVNFEGAWEGIRQCLPLLELRGGSVVAVASRAAEAGAPLAAAYAASKAALVSLTRSLALHGATLARPVRCNAVLPGSVRTPMWRPISGPMAGQGDEASSYAHIPLGRLAEAKEIASAVVFLASDEASYITGTTLTIDGGQSCR